MESKTSIWYYFQVLREGTWIGLVIGQLPSWAEAVRQTLMWGPEQEEGAGAAVRGMGLGVITSCSIFQISLSLLSQGIPMRAGRKQPLQSLAKLA